MSDGDLIHCSFARQVFLRCVLSVATYTCCITNGHATQNNISVVLMKLLENLNLSHLTTSVQCYYKQIFYTKERNKYGYVSAVCRNTDS